MIQEDSLISYDLNTVGVIGHNPSSDGLETLTPTIIDGQVDVVLNTSVGDVMGTSGVGSHI